MANYGEFCTAYSRDKLMAPFLVDPCVRGRKSGGCCRCTKLHYEPPLDPDDAKLELITRVRRACWRVRRGSVGGCGECGGVEEAYVFCEGAS